MILFIGKARELRELIERSADEPGVVEYVTEFGGDKQLAIAHQENRLKDLALAHEKLQQEVDILEARAKAARPVAEADRVIVKAAELWVAHEKAVRAYLEALELATTGDADEHTIGSLAAEMLRSLRALGDQLGEEGGEEKGC